VTTNETTKGSVMPRSRAARVASYAERLPRRLCAYGELLVGVALAIGATAIVLALSAFIALTARVTGALA